MKMGRKRTSRDTSRIEKSPRRTGGSPYSSPVGRSSQPENDVALRFSLDAARDWRAAKLAPHCSLTALFRLIGSEGEKA
jgi:ribosomal protein S7